MLCLGTQTAQPTGAGALGDCCAVGVGYDATMLQALLVVTPAPAHSRSMKETPVTATSSLGMMAQGTLKVVQGRPTIT